jgi:hypothetical protein
VRNRTDEKGDSTMFVVFKRVEAAKAIIRMMLQVAKKSWRNNTSA